MGANRLVLPDEPAAGVAHGRERFEAALAAGPRDGARSLDEETMVALAEAPVEGIGEVPYGSNAVFLVQLGVPDPHDPDQPMRAVYKPARGERPLWDFPRRTLYLRETATYLVDAALDLGHVPPTALRDGPVGPGSMQLFIHAAESNPSATQAEALEAQLKDVAMLDVLVNNADRKRSHLMVTADMRIAAIDNALTFLPYPRQRTALISLGGTTLPQSTADRLRALNAETTRMTAMRQRLSRLLSAREVEAFEGRVRELAEDPTYPTLDDWDGRPFEWW
jgi:hypothetical protein